MITSKKGDKAMNKVENLQETTAVALPLGELLNGKKVDARTLHANLGVRERFNDWWSRYSVDFVEGIDWWVGFTEKTVKPLNGTENADLGGRPQKNYLLTMDMAKHLALMAKTEAGRQIRQHLINLENRWLELSEVKLRKFEELMAKNRELKEESAVYKDMFVEAKKEASATRDMHHELCRMMMKQSEDRAASDARQAVAEARRADSEASVYRAMSELVAMVGRVAGTVSAGAATPPPAAVPPAPPAVAAEAPASPSKAYVAPPDTIDIGQFARLLREEGLRISRNQLFGWFRSNGFLDGYNNPSQEFIDCGWLIAQTRFHRTPHGKKPYVKTFVTENGRVMMGEMLRNNWDK